VISLPIRRFNFHKFWLDYSSIWDKFATSHPFFTYCARFLLELFATLSPLLSNFLLQFCQLMLSCGFCLPLNHTGAPNFDRN